MKIIAHTQYGTFESIEQEYTDELYDQLKELLAKMADFKYFIFETDTGNVFLTKNMIDRSIFVIEK